MEYLEVAPQAYYEAENLDNVEMIDHVSKKRKAKLSKKIASGKLSGRKLKRAKGIVAGTRQTIGGRILGVATGGASKLVSKAGRAETKQAARKTGKVLKAVAKSGLNPVLLPLLPLRPMMVKALKKEGVSVSRRTSLVDVANRFYKHVVKKTDKSFEDIDINDVPQEHFAAAIGVVVSAIVSFVKGLKGKKKQGQPLTKLEKTVVDGTEAVEEEIRKGGSSKEPNVDFDGTPLDNPITTNTMLIVLVVALILIALWYFNRKK